MPHLFPHILDLYKKRSCGDCVEADGGASLGSVNMEIASPKHEADLGLALWPTEGWLALSTSA